MAASLQDSHEFLSQLSPPCPQCSLCALSLQLLINMSTNTIKFAVSNFLLPLCLKIPQWGAGSLSKIAFKLLSSCLGVFSSGFQEQGEGQGMFGIKYFTFTEGISGEEVKSVLAASLGTPSHW